MQQCHKILVSRMFSWIGPPPQPKHCVLFVEFSSITRRINYHRDQSIIPHFLHAVRALYRFCSTSYSYINYKRKIVKSELKYQLRHRHRRPFHPITFSYKPACHFVVGREEARWILSASVMASPNRSKTKRQCLLQSSLRHWQHFPNYFSAPLTTFARSNRKAVARAVCSPGNAFLNCQQLYKGGPVSLKGLSQDRVRTACFRKKSLRVTLSWRIIEWHADIAFSQIHPAQCSVPFHHTFLCLCSFFH